jgi:hypothetical protein
MARSWEIGRHGKKSERELVKETQSAFETVVQVYPTVDAVLYVIDSIIDVMHAYTPKVAMQAVVWEDAIAALEKAALKIENGMEEE